MENINSKFIKAVETLEKLGKISSRKDIADKLNYKPSTLTDILKGRSAINTASLQNFCKMYNINLYWLFYGEGEMFNDDTPEKNSKEIDTKIQIDTPQQRLRGIGI
ncbi:MAG: XRE family transcriptional regulator [Bacteroidetes bacterium]|nr:MAG: XRE family transcriptional regulator [Bacteroidota bacterium]